jgi:hypothetical protein
MTDGPFSLDDQALELSQLVTLERLRQRWAELPDGMIEQGLQSAEAKRIAHALAGGATSPEQLALNPQEQRWVSQVRVLAGTAY